MKWDDIAEPTLVISGRVDPKTIAKVMGFFIKSGDAAGNKSELVHLAFTFVAKFAELTEGIEGPETNHAAIEEMAVAGLTWPESTHGRDIRKTLQWDVISDLSLEDAMAMKRQILDQRKKGENLMPSAVSEQTEHELPQSVWDELEALDKELRDGDEGS